MNRRTLLKGAAASSGLLLSRQVDLRKARAQAPQFTAEVIYEFTDFLGDTYNQLDDGRVASANRTGIITGRDVVDGMTVPCTWDAAGNRTVMDTGDIDFGSTGFAMPISPSGMTAGVLYATEDWTTAQALGITWASGAPALLPSDNPDSRVFVTSINDSGMVGGYIESIATRWSDGRFEQLPLSDGATSSFLVRLDEAGDAYGCSARDGAVFEMFLWRADGTVELLPLPDELIAAPGVAIANVTLSAIFEDGGYVVVVSARDGDIEVSGSWIVNGATFTKISTLSDTTHARISTAVSPTQLYGSVLGAGEMTGPAVWSDGNIYSLRDIVAIPNGGNLSSIHAVMDDGTLIASTMPIIGESTPASIVLLHPA